MTFAQRIADRFALDLGPIESMTGGANLLWRMGDYVVKELPAEDLVAITRASEFEAGVFSKRLVPMPEPIPDITGSYVAQMTGSRGLPIIVRVHRYVRAQQITRPIAPRIAEQAGHLLAIIQDAGTQEPAKIHWHCVDETVIKQFGVDERTRQAVTTAAAIVADASDLPTIFTHYDHKPENCLVDGNTLLVLDWDESGGCNPRTEAISSAAGWSWINDAPDPDLFASFIHGYGRLQPPIRPADWTKWLSSLGSWYEFMARQSLGEYAATGQNRQVATEWAHGALTGIVNALERIPNWCAAVNRRL